MTDAQTGVCRSIAQRVSLTNEVIGKERTIS